MSGGRRSRNKAAVGEPAAGSLVPNNFKPNQIQQQYINLTDNSGSLGLDIDEERRTERNLWRRASALCELSILEYLRPRGRAPYRVGPAGRAACPFSAENNTRPVRYETTGRTQAYQQAKEKKSKRDSPSSGERTGTCQA
ncbi:Hypothetical_protein [Hexamita inflata]|uniref:Hypothetical_protein n=1 Tax=Hexamita inflata TaxID=28002 RepID=A0AA86P8P2_9EUKA|nr:Hypothetical protein HINF_LOCUS21829 [Hexamita inflata]